MRKNLKIIYVCPFAHHPSHYPYAAMVESAALAEMGAEVLLCSFRGILDGGSLQRIPHETVVENRWASPIRAFVSLLYGRPKTRPLALLVETLATLIFALRLKRSLDFDLIYLRDGDPFIFFPHLLAVFTRGDKWAISLLGEWSFYPLLQRLLALGIWKPVCRFAQSRNRFLYLCQNRAMNRYYEGFLGGALGWCIREIPAWADRPLDSKVPSEEAKRLLGLPEGKPLFLHFGALHAGKDFQTVVHAIKELPQVLLVHAGAVMPSNSAGSDLVREAASHVHASRLVIREAYVPEMAKQLYFSAAEAVVLSYKKNFIQTASMLCEAARFGTPVIASDNGELGELVKGYGIGLVFSAEDSESLRSAIVKFLNLQSMEKEALKQGYKRFCEEFSLQSWAHRYMRTVASLWE